ncbi:MAG: nitroreductase family protein [bacterium]|nr:nitroreductase family protein [bacterium]
MDVILSRRSVRKFKADPVSDQDLEEILKAAMQAPSAINEQAWQFVVLQGDVQNNVVAINNNSPKGAPVGILVCCDMQAEKAEGYSVQDCSAATQNILLAAHAKGLGSVWTTVLPKNTSGVKKLLGLPEHVVPFAFMPIGYPEKMPSPAERYDEAKVHHNKW